ncbi:TPA: hypothetical protein I8Y21_002288 [Klebsiella oxytoca]|uniref:DOD-type homing endonuclease domain-containing protein n=1 Tax=Klebsiella oxytoca TaxID=571 RepID=A0AAN5L833_KLEOX|nr:hypothetical protein [Klebsiella oxytoca]
MTEHYQGPCAVERSADAVRGSQEEDTLCLSPVPSGPDVDVKGMTAGGFTKDTLVSTSEGPFHSGVLCRADKKPEVVTRDGSVLKSGGVTYRGRQEVFGLLTDSAYIKGTASHRVLRITPACTLEMAELSCLRKGDFVICQKGVFGSEVPEYEGETLDVSEAQELGRHISNMSANHHAQIPGRPLSDKFCNKTGYFSINIYNVLNRFDNFSYRVPDKLLCAPAAFIAAYLRGFFDGGTRFHLNRITATAACRELASDIVYLLSLFGINGRIMHTRTGFEVVIADASDIHLFIREIGFLNEHDFSDSGSVPVSTGIDYQALCDEYRMKASALSQEVTALPETLAELLGDLGRYKDSFIQLGLDNKFETLVLLSQPGSRVTGVTAYAMYTGREDVFGVIQEAEAGSPAWCASGIVVSDSGEAA